MQRPDDEQCRWDLVLAHRDRLVRLAKHRLHDCPAVDAEDIAHEAMLRAVDFAELDEARVGQFLTTVTTRLCADVHRDKARQARAANRLGNRATSADIADDVCDAMEAHWLLQQLTTLPHREAAVMLAAIDGEKRATTAARLGATLKALESAAGRARKSLRAAASTFAFTLTAWLVRRGSDERTSLSASLAAVTVVAMTATIGAHEPSPARQAIAPVLPAVHTFRQASAAAHIAPTAPRVRYLHFLSSAAAKSTLHDSETELLSTPKVRTPVAPASSAKVVEYPDNRSNLQETEYCLSHFSLTTERIGCPHS